MNFYLTMQTNKLSTLIEFKEVLTASTTVEPIACDLTDSPTTVFLADQIRLIPLYQII